jgi:hypothetical protein
MEQKEYILCAAIDYNGIIIAGKRHSDCYATLKLLSTEFNKKIELPPREKQGFLTSQNRFVDRKEAWKIAKENNQIKYGYDASEDGEDSILISENLY